MTKRKKTRRSKRRSSKRRKRGGGPRAIETGWLKKENTIAINIRFRNRLIEIADKIILIWAKKGFISADNITTAQLQEITVLLVDMIITQLGERSGVYSLQHIILSQMWMHTQTINTVITKLGNNKRLAQGYLSLARRKFPSGGGGGGGGGGGTGLFMPDAPSETIQVGDVTIFADGTRLELPSVEMLAAEAMGAEAVAQPVAILANPQAEMGGRRRKRRRRKRTRRRRKRRKRLTRRY